MEDFWEQRYRDGARQDYPWSQVVSFVMRHHDRTKPRGQTTVLEIGCGTGANLWFAAREGFRVIGFDASPAAIEHARARFKADGLEGTFHVASFAQMQLGQASVNMVIDRASLTCVPLPQMKEAIAKIQTALRPGGVFLTTPYSATTVGINAGPRPDDKHHTDITQGRAAGYGGLSYLDSDDIKSLLGDGWIIEEMLLNRQDSLSANIPHWHDEWEVIARRAEHKDSDT